MKFFVLDTLEGYWGCVFDSPRRSDGAFLEPTELDSTECTLVVREHSSPPDLVRTVGSLYLFSARAKNQMELLNVPPETGWIKVSLCSATETRTFFALVSQTRFDVIDRTYSEFSWLVPNKAIWQVTKWVLKSSALPGFDFFRVDTGDWLISDRVVDLFAENHFSGMSYIECELR